jgi:hypothetical protein
LVLTRRYFLTSECKRKWRRRRCRCGGRSLVITFSSCISLEAFKVNFLKNLIIYPQTKLGCTEKKLRARPAVVLQMTNYYLVLNKNDKRKQFQSKA